jgi:hypothetical protein
MLKFTSTLHSPFSRSTKDFLRPRSVEMCHVTGNFDACAGQLFAIGIELFANNSIASHNNAIPSFT